MADSPGGSLDDDLAAAFDGEFDEELVEDDGGGDAQKVGAPAHDPHRARIWKYVQSHISG